MTDLTRASELVELIDARFDEVTPSLVSGSIAADERHHQPWDIVHGGLYTATIETFATIGAYEAGQGPWTACCRRVERQRLRAPPHDRCG